jgi:hypothetical protein
MACAVKDDASQLRTTHTEPSRAFLAFAVNNYLPGASHRNQLSSSSRPMIMPKA